MGFFKKPSQKDFIDDASFSDFIIPQQTYETPPKTTASINGSNTYGATTFNIADVLQGTYAVKDQSDSLLVINKALTEDLQGLYQIGIDGVSSFGSGQLNPALIGAGAQGVPGEGQGIGPPVKESWVDSLTKQHPKTNAYIWISKGKASNEMHLPTSEDIEEDIRNHLQLEGLPEAERHPYYMDRNVGTGAGQDDVFIGSDGYVVNWGGGDKIIGTRTDPTKPETDTKGGEDAKKPGAPGAFQYLSPEDEQYYISMAWPFNSSDCKANFEKAGQQDVLNYINTYKPKKDDYRGKRVLVYSTKTKSACVCTPGEWGPHAWQTITETSTKESIVGYIAGISPDTVYSLGIVRGDEIKLGWVDDNTPLGPYMPTDDQLDKDALAAREAAATGETTGTGSVSDVLIEDLKYASLKILNHPNCWMKKKGKRVPGQAEGYATAFDAHMRNGNGTYAPGAKFKDSSGKAWLFPSLLNYMWYLLEGGFILDYYVGSIGQKQAAGDPSRLSYHSFGGAIDIGAIGLASEGKVYSISDQQNWRRVCDKMFNFLATLPENTRPKEMGSSFAMTYANNFKVFKDAHPTHIHIGFSPDQTGSLISKLKSSSNSNNQNLMGLV